MTTLTLENARRSTTSKHSKLLPHAAGVRRNAGAAALTSATAGGTCFNSTVDCVHGIWQCKTCRMPLHKKPSVDPETGCVDASRIIRSH
jgi:hypothetical protein